jgi:hypothetical protein
MMKLFFAKKAAKKAAAATLQKQLTVVAILGTTALIGSGLQKLHEKFPDWKILGYRRYIGL